MEHLRNIRAYTKRQLCDVGFDKKDYIVNTIEEECLATIDCKEWGTRGHLIGYFTLQDGRKILAATWQWDGFLGLMDIPFGSTVALTFKKASTGTVYLKNVRLISEGFSLSPKNRPECGIKLEKENEE